MDLQELHRKMGWNFLDRSWRYGNWKGPYRYGAGAWELYASLKFWESESSTTVTEEWTEIQFIQLKP